MISTTVYLLTVIGLLMGSSARVQPPSLAFSGLQGTAIKVNRMLSVTLTLPPIPNLNPNPSRLLRWLERDISNPNPNRNQGE